MILNLVTILFLLISSCESAEWVTSGSLHCTERCGVTSRVIGNRTFPQVYTCPVVDGEHLEHWPAGHSNSGRPSSGGATMGDDDLYPWDWCTPAVTESLESSDDEEGGEMGPMDPAPLPGGRAAEQGYNSGYNPGTYARVPSSLVGVDCQGACTETQFSKKYKCDVTGKDPSNFFCSPPSAIIPRRQLSSRNKLWCIGNCERSRVSDYYECKTMYGYDLCSPSRDLSARARKCHGSCQEDPHDENEMHHYKCFVDEMRTTKEHCGAYADDLNEAVTHALEYSNDDKICAGQCRDWDGDKMCQVVSWQWDEDNKRAGLEMSVSPCGPVKNSLRDTGIIIGCVIAAIAIIGVVTMVVIKKKYDRVNTSE